MDLHKVKGDLAEHALQNNTGGLTATAQKASVTVAVAMCVARPHDDPHFFASCRNASPSESSNLRRPPLRQNSKIRAHAAKPVQDNQNSVNDNEAPKSAPKGTSFGSHAHNMHACIIAYLL